MMGQSWMLGLNHMSDWSHSEYEKMLGLLPDDATPEEAVTDNQESLQRRDKPKTKEDEHSPNVMAARQLGVADKISMALGKKDKLPPIPQP